MTKRHSRLLRVLTRTWPYEQTRPRPTAPSASLPTQGWAQTTALCGLEAHLGARVELGESSTKALDVSLESSSGDPRVQATQRMISRVLPFQVGAPLHRSLLTPWRGAQPDEAGCPKAEFPVQCGKQCREAWKKLRVNAEICRAVWLAVAAKCLGALKFEFLIFAYHKYSFFFFLFPIDIENIENILICLRINGSQLDLV